MDLKIMREETQEKGKQRRIKLGREVVGNKAWKIVLDKYLVLEVDGWSTDWKEKKLLEYREDRKEDE